MKFHASLLFPKLSSKFFKSSRMCLQRSLFKKTPISSIFQSVSEISKSVLEISVSSKFSYISSNFHFVFEIPEIVSEISKVSPKIPYIPSNFSESVSGVSQTMSLSKKSHTFLLIFILSSNWPFPTTVMTS